MPVSIQEVETAVRLLPAEMWPEVAVRLLAEEQLASLAGDEFDVGNVEPEVLASTLILTVATMPEGEDEQALAILKNYGLKS